MKIRLAAHQNRLLSSLSIFSLFLLFGFTAVSLFAPIIKSNASESFTSKISTEINPVIAITSPEELSLELLPTPAGTFTSGSVDVDVSTNAFKGYELYLSAKDTDTFMKSELNPSDTTNRISSSFTGSVTSSTMAKNAWGYSLNSTDFSAVPAKTSTKKIKDITTLPTTPELKTTVHFGAKVDTTLDSGRYKADILFTAVAHPNPPKAQGIFLISSMQDMRPEICAINTTPNKTATQLDTNGSHHGDPNYVPTVTLTDTRDNNTYTVSKLADGKCWMTQNLRIAGKTLTPADSDVRNNYNLPASTHSTDNVYDWPGVYVSPQNNGYYGLNIAIADDWTSSGGRTITQGQRENLYSICPKHWRLPTTDANNSDFHILYDNYNSLTALTASPMNLTLAGHVYGEEEPSIGSFGNYWSSTAANYLSFSSYSVELSTDGGNWDADGSYYGRSIRCVAR